MYIQLNRCKSKVRIFIFRNRGTGRMSVFLKALVYVHPIRAKHEDDLVNACM